MSELNDPNSQVSPPKLKLPPLILAVSALAMIGVGISISEIFPKHGQPLGLMSLETARIVLYVCGGVAILCWVKLFRVIIGWREQNNIRGL